MDRTKMAADLKKALEDRRDGGVQQTATGSKDLLAARLKAALENKEKVGAAAPTSGALGGVSVNKPKTETKITAPAAPVTPVVSAPAGRDYSKATDAELERWRTQAQVDMDIDTVNAISNEQKARRAAAGKQTFFDRMGDTVGASASGTVGNVANAVGTVAELIGKEDAAKNIYEFSDLAAEETQRFTQDAKTGLGKVGQMAVDAGIAGGQMLTDAALAGVIPGGGTLLMGTRAFGGGAQEARQAGATLGQQVAYGAGSAAVSMLTEKLSNVSRFFKTTYGAGVLDDVLGKVTAKPLGKLVASALSEGGEEFAEALAEPLLKKITYDPSAAYDKEWLTEALYSAAVGSILGGIGGGADVVLGGGKRTGGVEYTPEETAAWQQTVQGLSGERQSAFEEARKIAENFGAKLQLANIENGAAGEYKNGVITMNPAAANPVREVLIHELTHRMETSGLYGKFSDRVLSFIAEDMGIEVDALRQSIMQDYAEGGVMLDEGGATKELVAKFAESKLFQDERSIQRLLRTDRNLFQQVYDFIRDSIAKVKGTGEEKFLIDAQRLYEKALRQADPSKETGQGKYAIVSMPDGKKYVRADRQVIFGNDPKSWGEQVENYINRKVRNGEDVILTTEDGDVLMLTRDTQGKASFRNYVKDENGIERPMTDDEYFLKLTAETHVDELAKISKRGYPESVPDEGGQHGEFAENGWNYRTAFFRDFDGKYYRLTISVALGRDGNTVYNISNIRERSPLTNSGSSASAALNSEKASLGGSIRNTARDVNGKIDIMPKLDGGQNDMGRPFDELMREQKETAVPLQTNAPNDKMTSIDPRMIEKAQELRAAGVAPSRILNETGLVVMANGNIQEGIGGPIVWRAEDGNGSNRRNVQDTGTVSSRRFESVQDDDGRGNRGRGVENLRRDREDAPRKRYDSLTESQRVSVIETIKEHIFSGGMTRIATRIVAEDGGVESFAKLFYKAYEYGRASAEEWSEIIRDVDGLVDKLDDLTGYNGDAAQNSMGRSFNELVRAQRGEIPDIMPKLDPAAKTQQATQNAAEMQQEVPDIMPKLADFGSQADAAAGDPEFEAYMDALAQDENDLTDPVTPADHIYDAKLRRLQQEEAPPETAKESVVGKHDLDELAELLHDIASPVQTERDARFEASAALVSAETVPERKTVRQRAGEAKSYFLRKMVDAGDSVSRIGKAMKDDKLYAYYNMARGSASAGINMIQNEQTDITGRKVGPSLNDIFTKIRERGKDYYESFQIYMQDLHNIDRMSLVRGENTARIEAENALAVFDRENPDIATLTEARLARKAESIDPEEAALAKERIRLLRNVNKADRMGNKPVFGWEVTADMSKERSDRLLREHPEFAAYEAEVRKYIDNMMQYRVDSGLMTAEDAAFLQRYYPHYVPVFRTVENGTSKKDRKGVQVGKTVGHAEGGNQKIVPLHEALGKQTMQVVREGSKNRFGARLLGDYTAHSMSSGVRKYILDAKEYESDFNTETFDEPEAGLEKDNTFAVYKDGKKYEMTVDPSMFDAVKSLYPEAQESNTLVKLIRAGNDLFKKLVTGYNPTFTIRNTVRDLQTAGLYSRDVAAFAKNYPLALAEIRNNGEYWKQYKALGGSFASVFDYQTGTVQEPDGKVAKAISKMEALNMAMEQAPRLAEFMSVVKAGDGSMDNLMDAMHAAADVTVNFGRAGTLGKVLNANFVPFLNPGIQGLDKLARRVTETKGGKEWAKLAARAAALGVAPAILNALLYDDDDEWEDLKDSDKDTNYMFKLRDGLWLKIPKGRELSILGMTADRIGDIVDGEEVNWRDFLVTVGNQVAPANPLRQNILAAWFDTDLFDSSNPGRAWYGGDIESQRLQSYEPGERYDSSTDIVSKWIGKQLNLSPKKINYLLDQYSGVVGDFVLPLLTPQAERNAFVKAFTVDSVSINELSGKFYDMSNELSYAKTGGDAVAAVSSRFWNKQQQACSEIYSQIREIESSNLSNKEKKEKVREARVVLNAIQKNALATLETYEEAVAKHLKGSGDDAVEKAYREANRECFGAEYALQVYNKDTYAKAVQAHENGVSYDDFYTYYFDTKDYEKVGDKSAATRKMEYLERSRFSDETKAELYFANLASDSDLKKQAELETSSGITAVQYWQYKNAVSGMSKKAEKLAAIDGLDLSVDQKNALYFANGWAESKLDEAPWYDISPKLWKPAAGSVSGQQDMAERLRQALGGRTTGSDLMQTPAMNRQEVAERLKAAMMAKAGY